MNTIQSETPKASQSKLAIIPLTLIISTSKNKQVHFVGLGEFGSKALSYCINKEKDAAFTAITDIWGSKDIPGINFVELKRPIQKQINPINRELSALFAESEKQSIITAEIKRVFEAECWYIIFVGVEHHISNTLTEVLFEWLTTNKKDFFFVGLATMQFFESVKWDLAPEIIEKKLERLDLGKFIDLKSRVTKHEEISMDELSEIASEELYKAYKSKFN